MSPIYCGEKGRGLVTVVTTLVMLLDSNLGRAGLLRSLFEANKEPAFAAHEMCQSLGAFTLLIVAVYLCTDFIIIIVMSVLLVVLSAYVTLEVLLRIKKDEPVTTETIPLTNDNVDEEDNDIDI